MDWSGIAALPYHYYPTFPVDKVKAQLQKVIDLLESGETDTEVIQEKLDEAVCGINDLQDEFYENDSKIETMARDCTCFPTLQNVCIKNFSIRAQNCSSDSFT